MTAVYDALGRMVENGSAGTWRQFVFSPLGSKIAIMNGQSLKAGFVPLPSGAQAVYNGSGLAYYRHKDHLGSSRLATTPDRKVYSSTAYAPFGEPYNQTGSPDASFTGQDQDTAGGLYDFLFRRLNSTQGRWMSPDPAGLAAADPENPQSWNRYAYVVNNPMSLMDAGGLDCVYDEDGSVSIKGGDCKSTDDAGYYVDCDGCLLSTSSASVDQHGTLNLYNNEGELIDGIQGFANPFVATAEMTVSSDGSSTDIITSHIGGYPDAQTAGMAVLAPGGGRTPANNTLPNGDVPIYGWMGHGADILAVAGKQATHDLGCAGLGWAVQGGSVAASGAPSH